MAKKTERPEKELEQEVTETVSSGEGAETPQPEPQGEKSEFQLLQEKFDELQDRHLRLMAEYDNFRKRSQREKDEIYQNAVAAVITKMLPVQDNFERADQFDSGSEEFAKGFELIEKSFADMLASFGAEAFGEVGEPFNPDKHHAVMHIEDETLGENVVSQVMQKGYKIGDRVLRYSMVQTAN